MYVRVRLIKTWHEERLRAAGRSRWSSVSRQRYPAVTPHDAHAASGPGRQARTSWWWVRRPGASSAALDVAGLPLVSQRKAARRLPAGLARQAGRPGQFMAVRQVWDDSRSGLVIVRNRERRRLRRELHDGLGPTLAGLMLGLDTARGLSAGQPDLHHLLGRLTTETQRAITDLRRIVHGLRPPALDELGLAGSLHEEVGRMRCAVPALSVSLDALPDGLAALPAAVEVACYRIVTEALTNVARHAHATRCSVRIHLDHGVCVEVCDNGVGLLEGWRAGAGIASMRERVTELGGELVIKSCLPHGTSITARLPVREPP